MATNKSEELARIFGYSGLLPFVILALLIASGYGFSHLARTLFDGYSAVIMSFLAGIYWPMALREEGPVNPRRLMCVSIGLALWGWFSLFLPESLRAAAFAIAFVFLYGIDRYVLEDIWTNMYLQMRSHLTIVVVMSQITVGILG